MPYDKEKYIADKKAKFYKDKQTVRELQPLLKLIYERQSANCPDKCVDKSKCGNLVHWD